MNIEKGIPIPGIANAGHLSKYPFDNMKVGDSFFADVSPDTISPSVRRAAMRMSARFTLRKERRGVRVWRIE